MQQAEQQQLLAAEQAKAAAQAKVQPEIPALVFLPMDDTVRDGYNELITAFKAQSQRAVETKAVWAAAEANPKAPQPQKAKAKTEFLRFEKKANACKSKCNNAGFTLGTPIEILISCSLLPAGYSPPPPVDVNHLLQQKAGEGDMVFPGNDNADNNNSAPLPKVPGIPPQGAQGFTQQHQQRQQQNPHTDALLQIQQQ